MSSEDPVHKFWRVRRTIFEMLADRGYAVSDKFKNETLDEFRALWSQTESEGGGRERLIILLGKMDEPKDKIIVFFPEDNKRVGVKPIRLLAEKMDEKQISRAILVVQQPLTGFARTAISEAAPRMMIEVFHENELVINITHHDLVSKHIPMDEKAKKQVLDRYSVRESQMPRIQVTDPVARYFGMKKGDLVKIVRPSETAGRYVTYRLCV